MLDKADIENILSHYPHASPFQRWHMRARLRLCPYDAIIGHLTGGGEVLDIGCGFGHFAWYLASARPRLEYYGADIDGRKIRLALGCPAPAKVPERPGPVFRHGDVRAVPGLPARFGNIVFLDVLYLMPWSLQTDIIGWALDRLAPGPESVLLIKTMDPAEGFPGWRAVAEEWIMVRLLGRTLSSGAINGARPFPEYAALGRERGFRCEVTALGTFNPSSIMCFRR
jgi:SAM-dependent methyltransferase